MRADEWVKQERGIIIDGKNAVGIRFQTVIIAQKVRLVHMIRPRGIKIDLLQKRDVRVQRFDHRADLVEILKQALLGPCPRFRAAVHEEAVIVLIRAEADVPAGDTVRLPCPCRLRLSGDHGKLLIVLDAVVGREHIGHIAARKDEHGQQYDPDDFECLFHDSLLWIF